MSSRVMNLIQERAATSKARTTEAQAGVLRLFANENSKLRPLRPSHYRPQYSPFFFMALFVTVISSIAFVGLLSVAFGAG